MSDLKHRLESILFSAGRKLSMEELSRLTKENDAERISNALHELKKELEEKQSSILLVQEGDGWKMTVHEKYLPFVRKIVTKTEMPKSIIETLAVVAFKAPVLQSKVILIRTNKAYRHLDQLEEIGYITREKKGRTKLIKLTQKFFEYFDVPPEKLKEKFAGFKELEKVIEQKEMQTEVVQEEKKKTPEIDLIDDEGHKEKLKVYDSEKIEVYETKAIPEPLEPAVDKLDGLEIYDSEIKEKKKKHKKKKKKSQKAEETEEGSEEGEEYAEAAEEEEAPEGETEEEPEEEPEEIEEAAQEESEEEKPKKKPRKEKKAKKKQKEREALARETPEEAPPEEKRITLEKIKEEAAKIKVKPREFATEGIFKGEIPTELKEKIAKRAKEIVYGKKEELEGEESPELESSTEELSAEERKQIEREETQEIDEEEKPAVEGEEKEELPEPEEDEGKSGEEPEEKK